MTDKYTIQYIDKLMNIGYIASMSFSARMDVVSLMNQAYEEGYKEANIISLQYTRPYLPSVNDLQKENNKLKEELDRLKLVGKPGQTLCWVDKDYERLKEENRLWFLENLALSRKYEDEIERFNKENEELKEELTHAHDCISSMGKNSVEFVKTIDEVTKENEALKKEVENWKSSEVACDEQYELLLKENQKLKKENEELKQSLNQFYPFYPYNCENSVPLREELNHLRKENTKLKNLNLLLEEDIQDKEMCNDTFWHRIIEENNKLIEENKHLVSEISFWKEALFKSTVKDIDFKG